jgi:hypothetical protein
MEALSAELEIAGSHLGREPCRFAFPNNPGVFKHIDTIGMWQREGNVLFPEQHGDLSRLTQAFERF